MSQDYLIFDPTEGEIKGIYSLAPEQVPFNTKGGAYVALELDGKFRQVNVVEGDIVERHDFDVLRRPLIGRIDAEAIALTADPFAAAHAAKLAEARGTGPWPKIDREAEATGQTRAEVIAAILARAEAAEARCDAVEVKRIAAKRAIAAARTIPELIAASQVSWGEDVAA